MYLRAVVALGQVAVEVAEEAEIDGEENVGPAL